MAFNSLPPFDTDRIVLFPHITDDDSLGSVILHRVAHYGSKCLYSRRMRCHY